MKYPQPTVLLLITSVIAAVVPDNGWALLTAKEVDFRNLPIVDLEVTDERFGDKVFTGSIEGIFNEMKSLKPELFVNETETDMDLFTRPMNSLEKRDGEICCPCWSGGHVPANNCREGLAYLKRLGSASCGVRAAPACARVSCSHACGMFLCNNLNTELNVWCGHIGQDVAAIMNECATDVFGEVRGRRSFSSHFIGVSWDTSNGC